MESSPATSVRFPRPTTQHFRFFDLTVALSCDTPLFANLFGRMYRRFTIARPEAPPDLQVAVWGGADNPWGRPTVVLGDEAHPLRDGALLDGFLYDTVLRAVVRGVRSHILVHAGVIVLDGRAIVLVGEAMHGKTTTVLTMLRRGVGFLSDEMAALSRQDGLVYPFPRSLRIRRDTLRRVGYDERTAGDPLWLNKHIVDVEDLAPGCLAVAAPPAHVVVLSAPQRAAAPAPASARPLRVYVDRADDALAAEVAALPSVVRLDVSPGCGGTCLEMLVSDPPAAARQVEALCAGRGVWVLATEKHLATPVDFAGPARLEPLAHSEAAMEMVRGFQGGLHSALLGDAYGGRPTRLFVDVVRLIRPARCWRLFVGPVEDMADLLCGLEEQGGTDGAAG